MRTSSYGLTLLFVLSLDVYAQVDIKRLTKDLKSRDPDTRAFAADSLGYHESAEAVALLVQALSDREPRVRVAAASALWKASETSKAAIPALRGALGDPDPSVVVTAAGALIAMEVPRQEVADPLEKVLQGGDPPDRFDAARLLTGVRPAGNLVSPMIEYFRRNLAADRYESRDFAEKALLNLGKTNDRTLIEPLMTHLRDAPPLMIPPILSALGALDPPPDRWVDTLLGYLGSTDPRVRRSAAGLLGKQTAAADVRRWAPAVARLAKDPDADVRGTAILTLGEGKGLAHEALPALLQVVSSEKDDALRARAADVVGEIGDAKYPIDGAIKSSMGKQALPILSTAAESDRSENVRSKALYSLYRLQIEPSAVAPVMARAAAYGRTSGIRTDALIRLKDYRREAAQVISLIEPLVNDPDPDVARIARSTLEWLTSKSVTTAQKPTTPAPAAPDPATRERGFAFLRENGVRFTDGMFARALRDLEEETVRAFLDAGMSPNQRFSYGELPLQTVLDSDGCGSEVKSLVDLLLDRGADASGSDDNGNTVLMTAAKGCDGEMVKTLIKAGAKATAKNTMGFTAIDQAVTSANASAAAALIAAGARLPAEKAKMYRETYAKSPKVLEIISMATKK